MNLSNKCLHCKEAIAEGYAPTFLVTTPKRLCRYCRTLVETLYLQSPESMLVDILVSVANHYSVYRLELYLRAGYGFGSFEQFSEGVFSPVYMSPLERTTAPNPKGYVYHLGSTELSYYVTSGFLYYLEQCYTEMVETFPLTKNIDN